MFCSRFHVLTNEGGMASHSPWENVVAMIGSASGSIDRLIQIKTQGREPVNGGKPMSSKAIQAMLPVMALLAIDRSEKARI